MLEHDESVCPGCGEQAAGQQSCPSCGLLIGSFLATATPALAPAGLAEPEPAGLAEPEPEPEPEPAAGPDDPSASPSSPWAAPFTAAESTEAHDGTPDETPLEAAAETDHDGSPPPVLGSFLTTEEPTIAEPETPVSGQEPQSAESSPEPAAPSLAGPFVAQALAVERDDEPAGETAEIPPPEVAADEAPAPVVPPMAAHDSNAISVHRSSDRRAAVAGIAALLFVFVVLMNRGLRRQ